jgi:Protein kinase domain
MGYEVVGLLGRGGSAVVELAIDGNGARVATKRVALTGSAAQMHIARQRLRREADILRNLAHPSIVPILDLIDDGSDVVLVFPAYVENLEDRVIRLGPLPPGEVARVGGLLLAALAAAHRQGVVHRDIKPANVLFNGEGEPALSDFGVAVTHDVTAGLTPAGTVIGTPMWMAPEQARGEPAQPASDVFSLAASLRFAATGRGPYAPGPAATVMGRAANERIEPLPGSVPGVLRLPLERMLDPRPGRRPSAAEVLGGLDGTTATPAVPAGSAGAMRAVGKAGATARRVAGAALRRLLGDPVERGGGGGRLEPGGGGPVRWQQAEGGSGRSGRSGGSGRSGRVHRRRVAVAAAGLVIVGAGVIAAARLTGSTSSPPAPHTNGKACAAGWYNLDAIAGNGCEAHSDYVAGTLLKAGAPVHANLVPTSATDSFNTHVSGDALNLCWGALHVTLTAPAQTAERLTVWHGATKVTGAMSADGTPATVTVSKPSCFGADTQDLRVTVTVAAAAPGASARDFTLTRDGGW